MRTLDDIVPPSRRKEMESLNQPITPGRAPLRSPDRPPRFPFATIIIVAAVIAVSLGAIFYFSNVQIEVTPKTFSAAVQSSFTATQSGGNLPFEIITAQKIASQSIKSSGTKIVNSSADGTITIYNTQTKEQRLIANTRFATTAGLIFRIRSAITVPGGSSSKPGSVTAKVYADQAGSTYNVGPTSFTIPGFSGTAQASQVYARSSSAMTGGASGSVPVVDAALETQTRNALAAALAPDLLASIKAQVPPGYLLVPGAATTTYQEITPEPSSTTGTVEIKQQGTVTAVIFPNASLAAAVAASVLGTEYRDEPVTLMSVDTLALTSRSDLVDSQTPSFSFVLTGTAPFVYTIDPSRIAAAVAGKTKEAARVALSSYPEVKQAMMILRPFWRQTFPQDPASITVVVLTGDTEQAP